MGGGNTHSLCLRSLRFQHYSPRPTRTLWAVHLHLGHGFSGQSINPRLALPTNPYHPADSHARLSVRPKRKVSQASGEQHCRLEITGCPVHPHTSRKIFWGNVFPVTLVSEMLLVGFFLGLMQIPQASSCYAACFGVNSLCTSKCFMVCAYRLSGDHLASSPVHVWAPGAAQTVMF